MICQPPASIYMTDWKNTIVLDSILHMLNALAPYSCLTLHSTDTHECDISCGVKILWMTSQFVQIVNHPFRINSSNRSVSEYFLFLFSNVCVGFSFAQKSTFLHFYEGFRRSIFPASCVTLQKQRMNSMTVATIVNQPQKLCKQTDDSISGTVKFAPRFCFSVTLFTRFVSRSSNDGRNVAFILPWSSSLGNLHLNSTKIELLYMI